MNKLDWTHKDIKIKDIRKLNKLYVIKIECSITSLEDASLFVNDKIFEERIKSYFLKEMNQVSREEILKLSWNMYITKGYYIKIAEDGTIGEHLGDPNKHFISYLEIAGPLGSFCLVYREAKSEIKKLI
jgi:hypothetical protein